MGQNLPKSSKLEFLGLVKWISFPLIFLGLFLLVSTHAHSAVWYVSPYGNNLNSGTSWADSFATIQGAINNPATADSDEIWVMEGAYELTTPSDEINVDKVVHIYGGFPDDVAIPDPAWGDRDWKIYKSKVDGGDLYRCFYVSADATLDGLYLNACGSGIGNGGGIYINLANPTINNSTFTGNKATNGAAIYSWESDFSLTNCIFDNNMAGNLGGAIYLWDSQANITSCYFADNSASYGGAIYNELDRNTVITNSIFIGNSADIRGGGIVLEESASLVTNCTLFGNSAGQEGGGFYNEAAAAGIKNCIIWGNTAGLSDPEIINTGGTSPTISYSDVAGSGGSGAGWHSSLGNDGGGNINNDPLFISPTTGDLNLRYESLCKDSGDNASIPAWVTTDFEGEQRIFNATVDMGADEIVDSDGDQLPDSWELGHFGNLSYDGADDPDGDSLTNAQEIQYRTDPTDWDSDCDGRNDGREIAMSTDPLSVGDYYGILDIEHDALVDLYNLTAGGSWFNNDNWLQLSDTINECDWYGISCVWVGDAATVTIINLAANNLVGTIPATLSDLTSLQNLRLSSNQISGSIPSTLGSLADLVDLFMEDNQISGLIPPELGNLSSLLNLVLHDNQLTGSIPVELGNLSNLQALNLSNNQLQGSIPQELGNLSDLYRLNLNANQLDGPIPSELGSLNNLLFLSLSDNQMSGSIPALIGDLANLQSLELDNNDLSGTIPAELGNLSNLNMLALSGNQLTGNIQPQLGNLSNLVWFWLSSNQLTGNIPPELGNLSNVQQLYLNRNQLTGNIPPALGNLASIQFLNLSINQLTGSIPSELGNLTNLQHLHLYNNQLSGSIPPQLGSLSSLRNLLLYNNQLTGAIPAQLGSLSTLENLRLRDNQLSGNIPAELGNLTNLATLDLHFNRLTGNIPPELGLLTNLWHLYLGNNQLTGYVPIELGNLTNLRHLLFDHNRLSGPIPQQLGNLTNLVFLNIMENHLIGPIPTSLLNLTSLTDNLNDFRFNALCTDDPDLNAFLQLKQDGGDWYTGQITDPDSDGQLICQDSDNDNDGLADSDEFNWRTDPLNPDTDDDGFSDSEEIEAGTDPHNPGFSDQTFTVFINSDFTETQSVEGWSWDPISVVTLQIDNGNDGSVNYSESKGLDADGVVRFAANGSFSVQEGDRVRMYDDRVPQNVKQHIVKYVTLTEVNPIANTLAGSAREGAAVDARVFDPLPDGHDLSDVADSSENWSVDFTSVFDIVSGNTGWVMISDTDGDQTQINWSVPGMDSDEDGMDDNWETNNGLDPGDPTDAPLDPDDDGLSNLSEYLSGTDPNVSDAGADGDGVQDAADNCPNDYNPVFPDCPECFNAVSGVVACISDYFSIPTNTEAPSYDELLAFCGYVPPDDIIISYYGFEITFVVEAYRNYGGWVYSWEAPPGDEITTYWTDKNGGVHITGQPDYDGDGLGDVCDLGIIDTDGDGVADGVDNCPFLGNDQSDYDGDGIGNPCDPDADNDGAIKAVDFEGDDCDDLNENVHPDPVLCTDSAGCPCEAEFSLAQPASSNDCNPRNSDCDGDGVIERIDTCPGLDAPQTDTDGDGYGDACDNCPDDYNENQEYSVFYKDLDGDWYSDGITESGCAPSAAYFKLSTDPQWQSLSGDCDDSNPGVHPGADVYNDCDPSNDPVGSGVYDIEIAIEVNGQQMNYGEWDPQPNDQILVVFKAMDGNTPLTTDQGSFPHMLSNFALSLAAVPDGVDNPTRYPGQYLNGPDLNISDDFDSLVYGTDQAQMTCHDSGGAIIITAEVTIVNSSTPGDTETISQDFYFPKDSDHDGIADFYENLYGNLEPLADDDNDGLINLNEYRGTRWGRTQRIEGNVNSVYDTAAYVPVGDPIIIRTNPNHRDLFVRHVGFDATHPFAVGEGFQLLASPVDIHALRDGQAENLGEYNIDVATVWLLDAAMGTQNPHLYRRAIRDWSFRTLGKSSFGGDELYGATCFVYKQSIDKLFSDKPHHDWTTYSGTKRPHFSNQNYWTSPNLGLDGINQVEDQNDNGLIENDDDTGNGLLDGDYPVPINLADPLDPAYYQSGISPPSGTDNDGDGIDIDLDGDGKDDQWDFRFELSPFNVDNDSAPVEVELPVMGSAAEAINPLYENGIEQVVKMMVTHELGHNVGVDLHTNNSSCAMNNETNNFVRDNYFSATAEALIRIHNTPIPQQQ